MRLTPLPPTDTRHLFRPTGESLIALLESLSADAWTRQAVGRWQVRDVVAHLTDIGLRRLSFHRDRHVPPPPPFPIESGADFVRFINQINADWVGASRRLSTRQLTEMYAGSVRDLADFAEALPHGAPGLFSVSWAGEMESAGWFDLGREYTEQWHHQAQIREAAGAGPMPDPAWLRATLLIALRGLPHAYRTHAAAGGTAVTLEITGPSGGTFTLLREAGAWRLLSGGADAPAARAVMSDAAAWRLLFNGLPPEAAREAIRVTGDPALAAPLYGARSIVV